MVKKLIHLILASSYSRIKNISIFVWSFSNINYLNYLLPGIRHQKSKSIGTRLAASINRGTRLTGCQAKSSACVLATYYLHTYICMPYMYVCIPILNCVTATFNEDIIIC